MTSESSQAVCIEPLSLSTLALASLDGKWANGFEVVSITLGDYARVTG